MADYACGYIANETDAGTLSKSGEPAQTPITITDGLFALNGTTSGLNYRMRGYSATLGFSVYWWADFPDLAATEYTGGGTPLTNVIVMDITGSS